MTKMITAAQAKKLILSGEAPSGMLVEGRLDLSQQPTLFQLPENLTARHLILDDCAALRSLPAGLRCYELSLQSTPLTTVPADLYVSYRLDLTGCDMLVALPEGLKVGSLILRGCTALQALPEGLDVKFLDIPGCVSLRGFPVQGSIKMGRLNMRGCIQIRELPPWLTQVAQLDISGCTGITRLPEGLHVSSWLDVADTSLQSLPASLKGVHLRWRGVQISERVAFHPETITVQEVLDEPNAERRRVMLERFGYDRFFEHVNATVVHADTDPGGERRLLCVPLAGDEPLVCLAVGCPSTGRRYMIRVPPAMRTCHQAAAWIAGFDNPDDYHPIVET
ncbi:MAG TPA: hypothetical protein VKX46_03245 [Ktedonobacteraceae bacterium]|nr:hypothetical protein [Ktedonobacteraceae bacterium]